VPIEPDPVVEVVPVWVEVVPGCVLVVPWLVLVVVLGVAGLGVTEPVLCAMAMPTDSANTDVANKILRIESCSLCTCVSGVSGHKNVSRSNFKLNNGMQSQEKQMSQAKLLAVLFGSPGNQMAELPCPLSHTMDKDRGLLLFFRLYLQ
jgi:hypothetical protein